MHLSTEENDIKFVTNPAPAPKKARPGRKGMNFEYSFTKAETEQLIMLWSEREILYNTALQEYSEPEKKDRAIREIADIMNIEVAHIHSKMNSLRSYYGQLRRNMLESQSLDNANAEPKQPSWPFFPLMSFLSYNCMSNGLSAKMKRSTDREMLPANPLRVSESQHVEVSRLEQPDTIQQNGTVMVQSSTYARSDRDEDELFGDLIANLMKKIPPCDEKDELKIRLQVTILEAKRNILPSK